MRYHAGLMLARILILVTLVGLTYRANSQVPETQLRAILAALQNKQYLSSDVDEYHQILTELITKSKLHLALNINGQAKPNSINFMLLAPDINENRDFPLLFFTPLAQDLLHNCNYVGLSNTIVCSQDFIDSFFNTYLRSDAEVTYLPGKHKMRKDDLTVATAKRTFLFWILGHELGHLIHGDLDSHFGTSLGIQGFGAIDELQQAKELRADSYCAGLIVKRSHATKQTVFTKNLEQILITLANDEVITRHLTVGMGPGLLKYYSSGELIDYESRGDHPEYVIRATRMLSVLAGLTNDAALRAMTNSFASHLKQLNPQSDK